MVCVWGGGGTCIIATLETPSFVHKLLQLHSHTRSLEPSALALKLLDIFRKTFLRVV